MRISADKKDMKKPVGAQGIADPRPCEAQYPAAGCYMNTKVLSPVYLSWLSLSYK